jgi:hypothetical protein
MEAIMSNDLDKIKMVYDYAKFHIGLYASVVGASIAIGKIDGTEAVAHPFLKILALLGISLVVAAGACGAMVAVNTPDLLHLTYEKFKSHRLVALNFLSMRVDKWLFLEHRFFWGGLALILTASLISFIL